MTALNTIRYALLMAAIAAALIASMVGCTLHVAGPGLQIDAAATWPPPESAEGIKALGTLVDRQTLERDTP